MSNNRQTLVPSSLTDNEKHAKLRLMTKYIEQDGWEIAEEIDTKTYFEYQCEKQRYIKENLSGVEEYYDKMKCNYAKSMEIDISVMKNNAYCKVLSARNERVKDVIDIARKRLNNIGHNFHAPMYKEILYLLLIQGLMKILEPEVDLIIRKQDQQLFNKILDKAKSYYKDQTGDSVQLNIKEDKFLDSKVIGGVYMITPQKHIRLDNSLMTRLDLVADYLLPEIRSLLFGLNPNRTFSS